MDSADTLYAVLGVAETASESEVRAAYIAMLKRWHPDVNPDRPEEAHRRTIRIVEAWQTLKDPASRAEYDRFLAASRTTSPGGPPPGAQQTGAATGQRDAQQTGAATGQRDAQWSGTATGQRAAETASRAADTTLDDLLNMAWRGTPQFQQSSGIGVLYRIGFTAWLAVVLICIAIASVGTLAPLAYRLAFIAFNGALIVDGQFVGFRAVGLGMLLSAGTVLAACIVLLGLR